ncbi:MAG TPA: glycosyltransferase family 2 protein [Candidatus Saccharimonadales bacterium]|nr:glycosyltransferase family 2 protein [Candidatus Saccharimonadales bacterium]
MTNASLFLLFRNLTIFLATVMLIKYFVFLMLSAYFSVREKARRLRAFKREIKEYGVVKKYRPKVSVIIPAWNEEVGVLKTLKSVLANPYANLEVIVVNDGSTDRSREIVDAFIAEHRQQARRTGDRRVLRQLYVKNGGKGRALNTGIQKSTGEIILTIDADSALAPDAIARLVEHFRDSTVSAAVGQVRIANVHGRLVGRIQQLEYLFGFYFKRAHCVMGAEYIYGGACAAFRRSATFDYFGMFDEKNKTEDIEMSMRTKFHGLRSVYAEDVICYTEGAANYKGLITQRLRWKKGRFDTFLHYRRLFFSLERRHNKWLGWFILPFALLAEMQLILEPIGFTLLLTYSVVSGEFVSLGLSMLFVGISYIVVALFDNKLTLRQRLSIIALWPFTWPLFYIVVWIEFHALLRGAFMVLRGDALEWQKWEREGI